MRLVYLSRPVVALIFVFFALSSQCAWALSVTFQWDAPSGVFPAVTGYKMHYGDAPGHYTHTVDMGLPPDNTFTISGLTPGTPYYFAATDYNGIAESGPSTEVFLPSLTVSVGGTGNGSVNSSPSGIACASGSTKDCAMNYSVGTQVTLMSSPSWGSSFAGWSGACSGAGSCTVSVDSVKNVTANFTASNLVKLVGTPSTYYSSIQAACDAAGAGSVIQASNFSFLEDLLIDKLGTITLNGGMDDNFQNTTGYSTVKSLEIKQGTVVIKNIIIQ